MLEEYYKERNKLPLLQRFTDEALELARSNVDKAAAGEAAAGQAAAGQAGEASLKRLASVAIEALHNMAENPSRGKVAKGTGSN